MAAAGFSHELISLINQNVVHMNKELYRPFITRFPTFL